MLCDPGSSARLRGRRRYLGVALIQMLKDFTPVIVMLGLAFAGIDYPDLQVGVMRARARVCPRTCEHDRVRCRVCLLLIWRRPCACAVQSVVAVVGISLGTAINCSGSAAYSTFGLSIMLASCVLEATRLVLTQYLLTNLEFSIVEVGAAHAPPLPPHLAHGRGQRGRATASWCPRHWQPRPRPSRPAPTT